jgi:hypothetical protein
LPAPHTLFRAEAGYEKHFDAITFATGTGVVGWKNSHEWIVSDRINQREFSVRLRDSNRP